MPAYRILLGDAVTGGLLAELPVEGVSYSLALNEPGELECTLSLVQPPDLARVLRDTLVVSDERLTPDNAAGPGRVTVFVDRDGVIVWSGLVWQTSADLAEGTMTLQAQGWLSYFRRRVLPVTGTFHQVDQALIAKALIDQAQSSFWDSVRISTDDVQPTGVLRDRTYPASELKNRGEALEQLAAVRDGFDFRFESDRAPDGTLRTRFLVDYPATGRATGIVFVLGDQITAATVEVDATQLATVAYAVGKDDLRAIWHLPSLRGVYPRFDAVTTHTDVTDKPTLDAHALRRLDRGARPVAIPSVSVDPGLQPPLGAYRAGDLVEVRGEVGFYSFSGTYRITQISVQVDSQGGEAVSLDLAHRETFEA